MHRQGVNYGSSKRKRRLSDSSENRENEPVVPEKRLREDRTFGDIENRAVTSSEERIPFTELSILSLSSTDMCQSDIFDEIPDKRRSTYNVDLDDSDEESDSEYFMPEREDTPGPSTEILFENDSHSRRSFGWLSCSDFWSSFCEDNKRGGCARLSTPFVNHPCLQPRMRSVLLEWIIEVCDVYKLHRETYYLAVDYLDRFLSITKDVQKTQLQLIGVTCLLLAAKYEEIFPPKVAEFAYITDGACTEEEIIKMELVLIKAIDWRCTILSVNGWISVLIQLAYHKQLKKKKDIMIQQYSVKAFNKVAQLLDLVSLDDGFLNFTYKIIAVTAVYLAFSKAHALSISGLELSNIATCIGWMQPFWEVLETKVTNEESSSQNPEVKDKSATEYSHTILRHSVTLELLEAGQAKLLKPDPNQHSDVGLLTPPLSSKKTT